MVKQQSRENAKWTELISWMWWTSLKYNCQTLIEKQQYQMPVAKEKKKTKKLHKWEIVCLHLHI